MPQFLILLVFIPKDEPSNRILIGVFEKESDATNAAAEYAINTNSFNGLYDFYTIDKRLMETI
jgi:hypothetical protein